ncbi:hypothetical protein L1887_03853 [Cichorium endivia]|nr:hypothetical protein L1887_03853 [Cichorium endivia]
MQNKQEVDSYHQQYKSDNKSGGADANKTWKIPKIKTQIKKETSLKISAIFQTLDVCGEEGCGKNFPCVKLSAKFSEKKGFRNSKTRQQEETDHNHEDEVTDVDDNDNEDDGEFETDSGEETETEHEVESQPLMPKTQNLEVSTAQSSGQVTNIGTEDVVSNQEKGKPERHQGLPFM